MKRKKLGAILFGLILMLFIRIAIGYASNGGNPTVGEDGLFNFPWFNATKGFALGPVDVTPWIQNADPAGAATFASVDTGQGANELYDMDQNVQTTDSPEFVSLSLTGPFINDWNLTEHFDYPGLPYSYEVGIVPGSSPSIYYAKDGTEGSILITGASARTVIQSALDYGGNTFVKSGVYPLTATPGQIYCLLIDKNNTNLILEENAILKLADGEIVDATNPNARQIIRVEPSVGYIENIKIVGGIIDGNRDNQNGRNDLSNLIRLSGDTRYASILNVYIKNGIVCVIKATGGNVKALKIIGCTIINSDEGILTDSDYGLIEGNYFENIDNDGVEPCNGALYTIITRNVFNGLDQAAVDVYNEANYTIVSNNEARKCGQDSSDAYFLVHTSHYCTVSENVAIGNGNEYCLYRNTGGGTYNSFLGNFGINATGTIGGLEVYNGDHISVIGNTLINNNHGIRTAGGTNHKVMDNTITGNNFDWSGDPATLEIIKNNQGYVTENIGVATLLNGNTAIVVNHGCNYTPSAGDIQAHPIETLNNADFWWVDTITATQFTIHTDQDPGADVDFAWSVDRH